MSGFEIVEERAHQNSSTSKRRLSGHNGGIANDDGIHLFSLPQLPSAEPMPLPDGCEGTDDLGKESRLELEFGRVNKRDRFPAAATVDSEFA